MLGFFATAPGIISVILLILLILSSKLPQRESPAGLDTRTVMQVILSLGVAAAGLYVILAGNYEPDSEKWAGGVIGTVLGYWLPNPR